MLTPKDEGVEKYPSYYQELAERFYTTSGESKIGPTPSRGQCYKTFYGRKLLIFVISWSVCPEPTLVKHLKGTPL